MKFSDKVTQSIRGAQVSARRLQDKKTSVDNLIYGMLISGHTLAKDILEKHYITDIVVDSYLVQTKGPKEQLVMEFHYPTTEDYDMVMKRAEEIAAISDIEVISTDIILLAIVDLLEYLPYIEALFMAQLVDVNELTNDILDVMGMDEDNWDDEEVESLYSLSENIKNVSVPGTSIQSSRKKVAYTKAISDYAIDLTKKAEDDEVDPVIGREKEIDRIVQILGRKTKNNPVLIGDPGVGKTSLIEGLSTRVVNNDVPEHLKNKIIMSLNMGAMLAGAKYRGEFEERLKKVLDECTSKKEIILFIDELHTVIGTGNTGDSGLDAANIMKPYLSDGRIQVIGATTIDEYRKIIEGDAALSRRFQTVLVVEPTQEQTMDILYGLKDTYESFHGINITDEALQAAVKLSVRYITDRFLPDKAIDVLDEAASMKKICKHKGNPQDSIRAELVEQYNNLFKDKEQAVEQMNINNALKDRVNMIKICKELDQLNPVDNSENNPQLTEEDICKVISGWTGVPVAKMNEDEKTKLINMEKIMHESIVGQKEAITAIATAIRRNKAGLRDPKKPIASFMFLGSTGVGKTETVKALAKVHYGSEENIIRLDMSEYMEKHTVAKLIGSPPGYVGHDDGGQLTNAVRTKPYSIVLFDEIEKAHPDVFNILLQMLDDGRLTDSKGRTVDFKNTIIIMTSNLGASIKTNDHEKVMGFGANVSENKKEYETDHNKLKNKILEACKKHFRPEFLNRIDELIVYHNLSEDNIREIIGLLTKDLRKRLAEKDITLTLNEDVVKYLISQGTDLKFGARPLTRAIQKHLMDGLSLEILSDKILNGDEVEASFDEENEKVLFTVTNRDQEPISEEATAE